MKKKLILSLGSNLGNRHEFLRKANNALSEILGKPVRESAIAETAPFGVENHPSYLNQILIFESNLPVREIFNHCCTVEKALSRSGKGQLLPRSIDIDVLAFGNEIIREPDLIIPHAGMHLRTFVLEPLALIWPEWTHPETGKTAGEMLLQLAQSKTKDRPEHKNLGHPA